jgi:hypothetical protein
VVSVGFDLQYHSLPVPVKRFAELLLVACRQALTTHNHAIYTFQITPLMAKAFPDYPFYKRSVDSPPDILFCDSHPKPAPVKLVVAPEYRKKIVYRSVWPFEYSAVRVCALQSTALGKACLLLEQSLLLPRPIRVSDGLCPWRDEH